MKKGRNRFQEEYHTFRYLYIHLHKAWCQQEKSNRYRKK